MIRVVCLLISALGWRRTTSVSPRPRRRIRQRVAVGEFDNNNNNNVNAAHFRPSNPIPLIRLACHSEFLSICNKNASRIGRPYEGGGAEQFGTRGPISGPDTSLSLRAFLRVVVGIFCLSTF